MSGPKITEALLDPSWKWCLLDVDGHKVVCLTLIHPRSGEEISSLLPRGSARQIGEALVDLSGKAE